MGIYKFGITPSSEAAEARWSHPSLEGSPPEFSVTCDSIGGRVLKGLCVIAWLVRHGDRIRVATPGARLIGWATSNTEAMLMAIRDQEAGQ